MKEYGFDDLIVGKEESLEVYIQPDDINIFANFSGDISTIHMDDLYAQERGFESRLVHGVMVGAYCSAFIGTRLPGKHGLLQSMNLEFRYPVYAPNSLTISGKVIRRSESMKVVTIELWVRNAAGADCVRAVVKSVLKF